MRLLKGDVGRRCLIKGFQSLFEENWRKAKEKVAQLKRNEANDQAS